MSSARKLAFLEKWSSDGATIIPPISSPTSPKATKFCCCPNRRRYNIKQPKLATTLHVRNIFVDNDFNFIDDPILNENDQNGDNSPQLTFDNTKNYKRTESWPSAKRAQKYNLRSKTRLLAEKENLQQQQNNIVNAAEDNDYDDIDSESLDNNSSPVLKKEEENSIEKKTENVDKGLSKATFQDNKVAEEVEEKEIEWRHNKSCHNNRNNCLANEHERKISSSSISFIKQQFPPQHSETNVKRSLKKICGNDDNSSSNEAAATTISKNIQQQTQQQQQEHTAKTNIEYEKECENIRKREANLEPNVTNEQITTTANTINTKTTTNATGTSPLIQRLSEISDLRSSLSKTNFSYKQQHQQQKQQQQKDQQYCSNCQFCFNQNCRNFSQLQKSLQQQENRLNKMTITTPTTPTENNDTTSLVNNNECDKKATATAENTTIKSPLPCLIINTTPNAITTKMPTTLPTSPNARSNTPLSPLTTTVIKTTMVKRSPANESTTATTTLATTTSPTICPALTTPTSASLSFEKSLAPPSPSLSTTKNIQDMFCAKEKENKPANNKNLTDATGAATTKTTTSKTSSSSTLSAPLSVKERIAALVAGNEQTQKQHDNFIKHRNQCNKPMKLITPNMTCQQAQSQLQQQQRQQQQHIISNNSSNVFQKFTDTKCKSTFVNDEVDGSQTSDVLKTDANDNLDHKSLLPATPASTTAFSTASSLSLLKSSKPGSAATIPRCSQSLTNHNAISTATVAAAAVDSINNKYESTKDTTTCEVADTVTLDKTNNILSNVVLSQIAAAPPASSSKSSSSSLTMTSAFKHSTDTSIDKSRGSNSNNNNSIGAVAAPSAKLARETTRSKLADLDNLDLALNLSNLPLEVGDDEADDPYFELQEYLERVKNEINEVFELHKTQQKLHYNLPPSENEQQQELQSITSHSINSVRKALAQTMKNQNVDTIIAAVSNDELSRSTESDSGFDSASCSGGIIGNDSNAKTTTTTTVTNSSGSNKLPSRAKMTTIEMENGKTHNHNDKQQTTMAGTATTCRNNQKMPTNTLISMQQQQQQQQQTENEKQHKDDFLTTTTTAASSSSRSETMTTSLPFSSTLAHLKEEQEKVEETTSGSSPSSSASSSTLKRLRKQLQMKSAAEAATDDVNMWANKFLRDLDNLIASDKMAATTSSSASDVGCPSPSSTTSPMILSAAASAVIQNRYGKGSAAAAATALHDRCCGSTSTHYEHNNTATTSPTSSSSTNGIVLRPEKHATIPLQSFNLDCGRLDNTSGGVVGGMATSSGGNVTKTNVAYQRTLSAPTPSPSHNIYQQLHHNHYYANKATCGSGSSSSNSNSTSAGTCMAALKPQRNSLAIGSLFNAPFVDQPPQTQLNLNLTNFQQPQQQQSNEAALNALTTACCSKPTNDTKLTTTTTTTTGTGTTMSTTKSAPTTLLKIEETSSGAPTTVTSELETLQQRRLRQLNIEMDNIRNTSIDQSQQLSALMQQNHYCTGNSSISNNKNKNLMTTTTLSASLSSPVMMATIPKKVNATAYSSLPSNASHVTCNVSGKAPTNVTTTSSPLQHNAASASATSYLLHGSDATKKGSTSTIWTSEESILRSVGAVDEDNNSTSSSACEEASGVLSSGKSGISLDSSGVENDNNESGIGTATPPKDMPYWRGMPYRHDHHHDSHRNQQDNESISSLEVLRKMKFQKGSSITSSDDPDLLEVLSLCDETHDDDDDDDDGENDEQETDKKSLKRENDEDMDDYDLVDEEDEGHDDFEVVTYCDCECNEDGDNSSASAGSTSTRTNSSINNGSQSDTSGVVLRRKYAASPIMVPTTNGHRTQKCRSHSLDTSSLPNSYHHNSQQGPLLAHQHHHNPQPQLQQQQQQQYNTHYSLLARKLPLLRDRHKDRHQLSLALRQEPFQSLLAPTHFHELPSPSSASLHSGHEILDTQELSTKSNSAPLLLKQEKRHDDFANQNVTLRYSRSQSDRYLAEIEAVEACKWLRAAGFPQYAQMYEDHQFPIDLTNVAKDHTNLENDQLQSLYRRLCMLNRCANMRLDQSHKTQTPQKEDSDDENVALSENWTFQPHIRRWSRIGEMGLEIPPAAKLQAAEKTESSSKESSPDRFEDDTYDVSGAGLTLAIPGAYTDDSADAALNDSSDLNSSPLRRTGSERLKDGAKAILRRVESIKSRRRKRQGIVLSGQALDLSQLGQRNSMRKPEAVYSTPPSPSAISPMHTFNKGPPFGNELKVPSQSDNFLSPNRSSPKRTPTTPRSMRASPLHFFTTTMPYLKEGKSDDSSSYYSDSQESSTATNKLSVRKTPSKTRRFLQRTGKVDDIGAHSDSECHQGRKLLIKDANSNTTEVKIKKLSRGGSLNLGRDGKKRDGFRSASFRSRSSTRKDPKPEEPTENVKRTPVVRWHSFQLEERPNMIFRKCFSQKNDPHSNEHGILFAAMSAGQLQMIRRLALVTLTGYMERYCPTHRSGWNWELPKFIKKIKMPDYKDKKVFGVPLLLILQRSGQALPIAVRAAFRWLQLNALDQIGLFRKSGVKSRILKLKELIEYSESASECMDVFDTQQAYDVADMLKQYFRDLPESLLTTKMSETFAAIFQHLPPEVRLDAVQSAVLLLPDENREILYALLEFLTLVAANSQYNQMTANNLAVCLAPSLFHSSISTGSNSVTASPRRKGKGSGVPDAKELFEAKASHECLAFMIEHYKQIYTAPKEKLSKCKFGYMEESKPLPLEALGEGMQFHNWRGYLYESTSATIKEGREKSRGWITISSLTDPNIEIAYKKVGDGHPLRLWRCITEIEGPPKEVLDYIIRQRASWDPNLLQSQTIKKIDDCTEIFQYAIDGQQCTDFCVLRSWRTDLPRGACVIVETSIDHAKAKPMFNAVRGVVLASRYLIEPCGSGRSRVMHLARVDVKGKTPEWYNKSYGHISSHYLTRIRLAFKNVAEGPESKV